MTEVSAIPMRPGSAGFRPAQRTKTQMLADFTANTTFEELPAPVVAYTKLVLLDSLICGIAARGEPRTTMAHAVASRMGGPPDATVFGLSERVSTPAAAMANAEIMNLLDADDTFYNASHFAVMSVAAALAEGQRVGASGRDLLRAIATGFDISARVNLAILVVTTSDDAGWAPIQGMGFATFGAAASAAVVSGLSAEQTRNAFGLAAWLAPTPKAYDMLTRAEFGTMKYVNNASVASAGVLATAYAEAGYLADQDVLDTDPGFIRAQGQAGADPSLLTEGLGERWWILDSAIKYYPVCRFACGPIDAVINLIEKEAIDPTRVQRVRIGIHPWAYAIRFFREPPARIAQDHRAPLHGAFHLPYTTALAVLGRTPGPQWYWPENLGDAEVWELAAKVTTEIDPSLVDDRPPTDEERRIRRFRRTTGRVTLVADDVEYERTWDYCQGDPWTAATAPSPGQLRNKLHHFCDRILAPKELDELADSVLDLDRLDDVNHLDRWVR